MTEKSLKPYTVGLHALLDLVKNTSQAEVARVIASAARPLGRTGPDFSAMQLNHILNRRRSPCLLIACAIDAVYGIRPVAMVTPMPEPVQTTESA